MIRGPLARGLAIFVVTAIGCVGVVWCVRSEQIRVQSVKTGMAEQEVIRILGEPTGRF